MQPCDKCGENTDTPLIIDRNGEFGEVCWDCYQAFIEGEADDLELKLEDR